MKKIGFIGLGAMGSAIIPHLMTAGHHLSLFARRPSAVEPFVHAGATAARSPADRRAGLAARSEQTLRQAIRYIRSGVARRRGSGLLRRPVAPADVGTLMSKF